MGNQSDDVTALPYQTRQLIVVSDEFLEVSGKFSENLPAIETLRLATWPAAETPNTISYLDATAAETHQGALHVPDRYHRRSSCQPGRS